MASESVELPIVPDVTKSPEVGKASTGNSDKKVVPRYLRASTGSCHDICKYGKMHEFESKERRSIPNRATRKQLYLSSKESIGGMVSRPKLSVDSKPTKMSAVVLKESVDTKATKMSTVVLKESADSETRISDALETNTHEVPTKSFNSQKHVGNEVKVNTAKTSSVKVKPSLLKSHTSPSTSHEISSSTDKEVRPQSKSTFRKVEAPSKPTPKKVKTPSKSALVKVETLSKPTPKKVENTSKSTFEVKTSSKSTAAEVEAVSKSILKKVENPSKSTIKKVENPSKSTSKVKTSSKSTSKVAGTSSVLPSVKHLTGLNSNRVSRKKVSSMNSSEGFGDKRNTNSEIKMEKKVSPSKTASSRKLIAPKKTLSSPRPSLKRVVSLNSIKHKGLKTASNLRNKKTVRKVELEENNNVVEEKTLYVIKTESKNKTLKCDQNASYDDELYLPQLATPKSSSSSLISQCLSEKDQDESEYTTSEFEVDSFSGNCDIECLENEGISEVAKKGKPRKEAEDKDSEMIKLKFRRGKVVDNQIEKNTTRRLKFRRGKTLAEKANDKDDGQRKSFKKRDETSESKSGTTNQEKVVLRHQDMQDKKDSQGLLNNVIEETASKLVEARKSKVKALVGAFETVISLQEKKPSANTGT
ncbi:uncharacterized protein [Cicer arietinum]|uniref:Uncharacterized protein LOC101502289 n=1 Tax=Cicer arietinum TaxID=3827 RepID=A0A1S2XHH8_CICAR|nr:uncharacterized protein LOC101502289 [Cicer arietinum]